MIKINFSYNKLFFSKELPTIKLINDIVKNVKSEIRENI